GHGAQRQPPRSVRGAAGLRSRGARLLRARVRARAPEGAHRRVRGSPPRRNRPPDGRARLVRSGHRRGLRRLGRRAARGLPLPRGDRPRGGADRGLRSHADRGRSAYALRDRGAEAPAARPRRRGRGAGHRHVGARGRVGCRRSADASRAPGRRVGPRRYEDLVLLRPQGAGDPDRLPHRPRRVEARGAVDDPRAARGRGAHRHADRHPRRQGDQRAPSRGLPRGSRRAAGGGGARLDPAHGRAQLRARHPRRLRARPGPACLRRGARLLEGAPAVRALDRLLPGHPAQVRRSGHRPRPGSAAGARGRDHDRRRSRAHASSGGLHGEARLYGARQALCPRGHADHGRLRVRDRVPDGALPAQRGGDDDLRRDLGDPEEHHREDAGAV
ncbi:MAG: hypothetical protein AVDCRST_MAG45-502, partial [uncultured Solirubrobacterales bacterium]